MINNATHKLLEIVESKTSHVFQVKFKDLDVFHLKCLNPIDSTVYGLNGQWSAEIVVVVRLPSAKEKLFKPGSLLDFKEEDVREISDVTTNELIFMS